MSSCASRFRIIPGGTLRGDLAVPGDKSISHRALILGAIAEGETIIHGFLQGEDTLATANAFRQMGVGIEGDGNRMRVRGVGLDGLSKSDAPVNLGNSGTAARLLSGLLAAQAFDSELIGDASLMTRPMLRIIEPLRLMNAAIQCSDRGTLPIRISGGRKLRGIRYELPVASAQLKSCLLLAGLYAEGETVIIEKQPTRDHTERMLDTFAVPLMKRGTEITLAGVKRLRGAEINVPADFSSAAFFIVAATLMPGSRLTLKNVGVNPTRDAMLEIMRRMGANIALENRQHYSGEPVADIYVESSPLQGIDIPPALVPGAIDEFPAILIAAAAAAGVTRLTNAAELRIKESDRIQAMLEGFAATGIQAEAEADGLLVKGGRFQGGVVDSHGDHRIAMAFAVAGMVSAEPIVVNGCENVATSFPGFVALARRAGMDIEHV